jgi:hypothetical protein
MNKSKIEFAYQWEPVLIDENREYLFPQIITSFMKRRYKHPAIYRWNIFKKEPEDEKLIYIGEAQELCPQRISGYLNPGPSQRTNKRIKEEFQGYLKSEFKIGLEILQFDKINIEDFTFINNDLRDKHFRRFLEELMIIIYKQKGFKILNL